MVCFSIRPRFTELLCLPLGAEGLERSLHIPSESLGVIGNPVGVIGGPVGVPLGGPQGPWWVLGRSQGVLGEGSQGIESKSGSLCVSGGLRGALMVSLVVWGGIWSGSGAADVDISFGLIVRVCK